MNYEKTGSLIKKLRTEKKLTQKQLAERLGVSDKAVSKWETGKGFPDISIFSALADVFGADVENLLMGSINKNEKDIGNMKRMKFYVCEDCGNSYHIDFKPTKVEGVCDKCGGKAVQRKDDAPETVLSRLKTYHELTAPLKDFYAAKGILVTVEGQDTVEDTSKLVLEALK